MSYLENMDLLLGSYSKGAFKSHQNERDKEVDIGCNELQQNATHIGGDTRSLLNKTSRENSEITVETAGMII